MTPVQTAALAELQRYLSEAAPAADQFLAGYRLHRTALRRIGFAHPREIIAAAAAVFDHAKRPTAARLHALVGGPLHETWRAHGEFIRLVGYVPTGRRSARKRHPECLEDLQRFVSQSTLPPEEFLAEYRSRRAALSGIAYPHPQKVIAAAVAAFPPTQRPTLSVLHGLLGGPAYEARPVYRHGRLAELQRFLSDTSLAPDEFLAGYRHRRAALVGISFPHPLKVIVAAAAVFDETQRPTVAHFRALVGGPFHTALATYPRFCSMVGHVAREGRAIDRHILARLGMWQRKVLGPLPRTQLDPVTGPLLPAPELRQWMRVFVMVDPALRVLAGVTLLLASARGERKSRITEFIHALEDLAKLLAGRDPRNPAWLLQCLRAFLDNETLTIAKRVATWATWVRIFNCFNRYLDCQPEVALRFARSRIAFPADLCTATVKILQRRRRAAKAAWRTQRCKNFADNPALAPVRLECRYREIATVHAAFVEQCAALASGAVGLRKQRSAFSITLACLPADEGLAAVPRTLDFGIVSTRWLAERLPGPTPVDVSQWPADKRWLIYEGAREGLGPPLLEMLCAGCFQDIKQPRSQRAQFWLPQEPWPTGVTTLLRARQRPTRLLIGRALRRGIAVVPIEELHHAAAIGRAAGRSAISGARIGEILQQRFTEDAYRRTDGNRPVVYAYQAIPKGRHAPEEFLITEEDFEAIVTVVEVAAAIGEVLIAVSPAQLLARKCKPAEYLYQRSQRLLRDSEVTFAMSLLLWPDYATPHDLRHAGARSDAHLKGASFAEVALKLHHRTREDSRRDHSSEGDLLSVTRQYCQATPLMKANFVRRLAKRASASATSAPASPPVPAANRKPATRRARRRQQQTGPTGGAP